MRSLELLAVVVAVSPLAGEAAAGRIEITATPSQVELRPGARAVLRIDADEPPVMSASVGHVQAPRRIGRGAYEAVYVPPRESYPQVAIIVATGSRGYGWLPLPLAGTGDLQVKTDPHADAELLIGKRRFGPVRADDKGRAVIPIVVPPGTPYALFRGQRLSLPVPVVPRPYPVLDRSEVPASARANVTVRVFVVGASGRPRTDAPLRVEATDGKVSNPWAIEPGVYVADWDVLPGAPGEATLSAWIAGELGAVSRATLLRSQGPARVAERAAPREQPRLPESPPQPRTAERPADREPPPAAGPAAPPQPRTAERSPPEEPGEPAAPPVQPRVAEPGAPPGQPRIAERSARPQQPSAARRAPPPRRGEPYVPPRPPPTPAPPEPRVPDAPEPVAALPPPPPAATEPANPAEPPLVAAAPAVVPRSPGEGASIPATGARRTRMVRVDEPGDATFDARSGAAWDREGLRALTAGAQLAWFPGSLGGQLGLAGDANGLAIRQREVSVVGGRRREIAAASRLLALQGMVILRTPWLGGTAFAGGGGGATYGLVRAAATSRPTSESSGWAPSFSALLGYGRRAGPGTAFLEVRFQHVGAIGRQQLPGELDLFGAAAGYRFQF